MIYFKYSFVILFILIEGLLVSCRAENTVRTKQSEAMYSEELNCPDNSHVEYAPWGETGWVKACKQNHGKYVVWEGDKKKIDGQFINGKKTGIWTYYKDDGSIEKTANYH